MRIDVQYFHWKYQHNIAIDMKTFPVCDGCRDEVASEQHRGSCKVNYILSEGWRIVPQWKLSLHSSLIGALSSCWAPNVGFIREFELTRFMLALGFVRHICMWTEKRWQAESESRGQHVYTVLLSAENDNRDLLLEFIWTKQQNKQ